MTVLKGALFDCDSCEAHGLELEWVPNFGWACASCGFGIHGQDQHPQVDVTGEGEQQFEMWL